MKIQKVKLNSGTEIDIPRYEVCDVVKHVLTGEKFLVIGNSWLGKVITRGSDHKKYYFLKEELDFVADAKPLYDFVKEF